MLNGMKRTNWFNLRCLVFDFFDVLCLLPAWPYFNSPVPVLINLFAALFLVLIPLHVILKQGSIDRTCSGVEMIVGLLTNVYMDLLCELKRALLVHWIVPRQDKWNALADTVERARDFTASSNTLGTIFRVCSVDNLVRWANISSRWNEVEARNSQDCFKFFVRIPEWRCGLFPTSWMQGCRLHITQAFKLWAVYDNR